MRAVQVAVPVPAIDALTYSLPDSLPTPVVGSRVLVPLGKRVLTGVVVGSQGLGARDSGLTEATEVKDVIDVLDDAPFLPADVVKLVGWVANYYACGAGEALAAAMPPRAWIESERHAQITQLGLARELIEGRTRGEILHALRDGKPKRVDTIATKSGSYSALAGLERDGLIQITRPLQGWASAFRTVRVAAITAQGLDQQTGPAAGAVKGEGTREKGKALGERQLEALDLLAAAPQGLDTSELAARGISSATLNRLATLGFVTVSRRRVERDPFEQDS